MGKKMKKLLEIVDFFTNGNKKGAGNHIPNRFQEFQGLQLN